MSRLDQLEKAANLEAIGHEVTGLTAEKNLAYGDATRVVAIMMAALYPDGIAPDRMTDALLITRILDKVCRIARGDKSAFNESPYRDIAGYGILGAEKDEHK